MKFKFILALCAVALSVGCVSKQTYNTEVQKADTYAALDKRITSDPDDPAGYAVLSSAYLFSELDRLSILESDFFSDDTRIADKKKLKPDPLLKAKILTARFFAEHIVAQAPALAAAATRGSESVLAIEEAML